MRFCAQLQSKASELCTAAVEMAPKLSMLAKKRVATKKDTKPLKSMKGKVKLTEDDMSDPEDKHKLVLKKRIRNIFPS